MVELLYINTNDADRTKYRIKLLIENTLIVTKEWLRSGNVPDIGYIIIYSEDYINESKNLTQFFFENIMFPEVQ